MQINIKQEQSQGTAIATKDGKRIGEMTYSIAPADFIIIDHTMVEPDYRGEDVGKKLLDKVVEMARKNNLKIMPLCPFANAMFKKNADLRDVLKD